MLRRVQHEELAARQSRPGATWGHALASPRDNTGTRLSADIARTPAHIPRMQKIKLST